MRRHGILKKNQREAKPLQSTLFWLDFCWIANFLANFLLWWLAIVYTVRKITGFLFGGFGGGSGGGFDGGGGYFRRRFGQFHNVAEVSENVEGKNIKLIFVKL